MPITPLHPVERVSQHEFRELSYTVMGHVFDIHSDFGRLFAEGIYPRELACRMPDVELEFPITVSHANFSTTYYVDALIAKGAAFEFKAAETLMARHQGQLYNYLLLLDLAHGKLVNMRPESVEHEFVNSAVRRADRHTFEIITERWNHSLNCAGFLLESMVSLLEDWGAGLETALYVAALTEFLGGEDQVVQPIDVRGNQRILGQQPMRMAADGVAFKLTAFKSHNEQYEEQLRRLLKHADLNAVLWVNIALDRVTFTNIEKKRL